MTSDPDGRDAAVTRAAPANRMAMAVFALAGLLIAVYTLLHKLGVIMSLACGTGTCEVVQSSRWSDFLGVPVPAWGIAGYGAILGASLIGIQPAWLRDRRIALLLLVGASVAFLFSTYLTVLEAFVIRAWCRWCIASAVASTLLFLFALPE
ncbi:MAG: vitamin K epoxide reductase family protein, partial [Gemmatimonadetes bacterium]|nr:vitamin K epoxide reductase family protein [Gemmatimonadota bacterium]